MLKTIDEITIIDSTVSLQLINNKNRSRYSLHKEDGTAYFHDAMGNMINNSPSTVSLNFEVFKLREPGQTIKMHNGSQIAYLSDQDVHELAERTFYEEGQTRVYDFLNREFTIKLE